jgi:hypothetical protein
VIYGFYSAGQVFGRREEFERAGGRRHLLSGEL